MSVVGIFFGLLSAVALAVAAAVPPILGLLSLLLSPLRAAAQRLQRGLRA